MRRRFATVLALAMCVLAIIVPIAASLYMARRQSMDEATDQATILADDVLYRGETAGAQAAKVGLRLAAMKETACTDEKRALMREITMDYAYLEAIGYGSGNQLTCSAVGPQSDGVDLGPPDYVSSTGVDVRLAVKVGNNEPVAVLERAGIAIAIHPESLLDLARDTGNISLGAYSLRGPHMLWAHRGFFNPAWTNRLGVGHSVAFFDGQYLVVIKTSNSVDIATYAAIPLAQLNARLRKLMLILLPIGLVLGSAMAVAILFLARQRRSLRSALRMGLKRKEFVLHYQPIVDLASTRMVGVEALLRWPKAADIGTRPELFIHAAEECGLIERFTEYVLDQLVVDGPRFFSRYPDCYISVNVASADLHSGRVVDGLHRLITTPGVTAKNIIVEITEHSFVEPDSANRTIAAIHAMGIRVTIDDFGTGYSSLSHLTNLQADYLKIDKVFVDAIGTGSVTSEVVLHIIEMAGALNMTVVAEGVETQEQADFLRQQRVPYAQGWLFSTALPLADLVRKGESS
ncbi:MAG: EAL domain-containing protein [Rhodanobacter sp.]